jgi:hypothetical protein
MGIVFFLDPTYIRRLPALWSGKAIGEVRKDL